MHELPTGTVTLLFSDIEESTRHFRRGDERYANVLEACRHLLRTACKECHGHEVDTQGDSFFVAFARATDAVSAALAVQRALASHAWPEGVVVRLRMRLHTGEPHLAAEGYVGLDVHRAARIMHAGHGGQILLSQTTRDLVEHDLPEGTRLRDLGAHRLKDLEHPSHLYQLVIEGLPADFPPLRTLDLHAHNLPVQLTPLIGREQEIAAVCHLLRRQEVRLLTLTGPGGTGKTRLGLQVAAELSEVFSDGVFFVNLAPLSDPELVVPTIAQALGLKEAAGQPLLDLVSISLHEKELLLLDNFEQVVEAAVEVSTLLARCPRLNVLVTSRAALHVQGEHEFAVPPLAIPDPTSLPDLVTLSQYEAVALFIARAQAVKLDFQLTNANAPAVAEICIRLDGLPLAIELAAARIKMLPPQALLARLGQRFTLLTSGAQDVPARQQTLRNTIAWSYDLLDTGEQQLFRRLSVFGGGATPVAIEVLYTTLGDEPGLVLDGIASLIDKSLLRQSEQEAVEPRFVMLETIREYGREALTVRGEVEATRQAHAVYYVALAVAAEQEWESPQEAVWVARLEQEHDNLRAAMSWLLKRREAEMALRLGAALWWFWQENGSYHEGWSFLERALEGSEEVAVPVRAKALLAAGNMCDYQGRQSKQGETLCQESLALFRAIGDTKGMGTALFHLGMIAAYKGNFAAAHSRYEESLVLSREVHNKNLVAWSLEGMVEADMYQGEYARARPLLEECLTLFREVGNTSGIAASLHWSAYALFSQGDLAQARAVAEESLALFREIGIKSGEAYVVPLLGEITFYQGDTNTARLLFEKSCTFYREVGNEVQIAWTLSLLGKVVAAQGDLAAARAFYEESLIRGWEVNGHLSSQDTPPALEGLAAVVAA